MNRKSVHNRHGFQKLILIALVVIAVIGMTGCEINSTSAGSSSSNETSVPIYSTTPTDTPDQTNTPTSSPTPTASPELTSTPSPSPSPSPTPIIPLKKGMTGDTVKAMQDRLIELDYLRSVADGDFGNATKDAVIAFQKRNDLKADGVAGEQTLTLLFSTNAEWQEWVWVAVGSGTKYHNKSSCSGMKSPTEMTIDEAIKKGYDPCKKCY